MKKIIFAAAALAVVPQVAAAQNLPNPVIAVVDGNKAATECTACRTALTQLQQQGQAVQTLRQQLAAPLQTESQQLQAAVDALKGKEPDAALKGRIDAFRTKQQQAERQVAQRVQTLERNQQFVLKQINDRIGPAVEAVQARRRANLVLDASAVLKFAPTLDITSEVTTELNRTLTTISTTAPVPQQQNPQGR